MAILRLTETSPVFTLMWCTVSVGPAPSNRETHTTPETATVVAGSPAPASLGRTSSEAPRVELCFLEHAKKHFARRNLTLTFGK
jgi:hypothetical protein